MPRLSNKRRERFARLIAMDASPVEAAKKAGYVDVHGHRAKARMRMPEVAERIAELKRNAGRRIQRLDPVIHVLMRAAEAAIALRSAAALTSARGLLIEAARLKQILAATPAAARRVADDDDAEMTEAEWLAAFAPKPVDQP